MGSFNNPCEIPRTRRLLCLGDFNGLSAARRQRKWWQLPRFYDAEPYLKQDPDDLEFQVQPGKIGRKQLADRRQTQVLLRRDYMVDAAAYLNAPWDPTVGHWEDGRGDPDPWGRRRIDLILATRPVAPALISYATHRSSAGDRASDHRSPFTEFDPGKIVRDLVDTAGATDARSGSHWRKPVLRRPVHKDVAFLTRTRVSNS
ncbi:hypothetical protein [Streptomyces celluloflavus]|uniref:hypothetical protein n=1 Tax=Streptomyces celluloflavus TaxID=58344 RepID=UPI0034613D01|nr:hypothetical protein OG717_30090 [Streptomyces celluloflavus]